MQIVVAASDEQWNELTGTRPNIDWQRVNDPAAFVQFEQAVAFFSLQNTGIIPAFGLLEKPVFINGVAETLAELQAAANIYRINGWATFLNRPVWEIAGQMDENIKSIFKKLDIEICVVPDEPGFVTARIISMIINEAFFAVEENVSSRADIDTAMKLGTNYPYGPFEWAALIGTGNILSLLTKLNISDSRYRPADLLIKEVTINHP